MIGRLAAVVTAGFAVPNPGLIEPEMDVAVAVMFQYADCKN